MYYNDTFQQTTTKSMTDEQFRKHFNLLVITHINGDPLMGNESFPASEWDGFSEIAFRGLSDAVETFKGYMVTRVLRRDVVVDVDAEVNTFAGGFMGRSIEFTNVDVSQLRELDRDLDDADTKLDALFDALDTSRTDPPRFQVNDFVWDEEGFGVWLIDGVDATGENPHYQIVRVFGKGRKTKPITAQAELNEINSLDELAKEQALPF